MSYLFSLDLSRWLLEFGETSAPSEGGEFYGPCKVKLASLISLAHHSLVVVSAGDILSSTGEQLSCEING